MSGAKEGEKMKESKLLLSMAVAGMLLGAQTALADHHEEKAKEGKNGCQGKDSCKGKDKKDGKHSCKSKDGKDSCQAKAKSDDKKAHDGCGADTCGG